MILIGNAPVRSEFLLIMLMRPAFCARVSSLFRHLVSMT